jgi:hypothetical protein
MADSDGAPLAVSGLFLAAIRGHREAFGYRLSAKRFSSLLVSESVGDVPISNPTIG